jgi:SOS response regulatory protein OraA/RecX
MSNKAGFGRDADEFLKKLGNVNGTAEKGLEDGAYIRSVVKNGDGVIVSVTVSNSSGSESLEFILLSEAVEELGLCAGKIPTELLPEIEYYSKVAKAYFSACSSFAFAPSSLRGLYKKLLQKGFEKDACELAIEAVKTRGFVDEAEIAVRRAQMFIEKRWGRSRIFAKLREEGFESSAIDAVKDNIAEFDFVNVCSMLILRKFGGVPEDRHERELMIASLTRMGYSTAEIRSAIGKLQK